jgi:hypothetical protein
MAIPDCGLTCRGGTEEERKINPGVGLASKCISAGADVEMR